MLFTLPKAAVLTLFQLRLQALNQHFCRIGRAVRKGREACDHKCDGHILYGWISETFMVTTFSLVQMAFNHLGGDRKGRRGHKRGDKRQP